MHVTFFFVSFTYVFLGLEFKGGGGVEDLNPDNGMSIYEVCYIKFLFSYAEKAV